MFRCHSEVPRSIAEEHTHTNSSTSTLLNQCGLLSTLLPLNERDRVQQPDGTDQYFKVPSVDEVHKCSGDENCNPVMIPEL